MPRYEVEVTTIYYDVVTVVAPTPQAAEREARYAEPTEQRTFSEAVIGHVRRVEPESK